MPIKHTVAGLIASVLVVAGAIIHVNTAEDARVPPTGHRSVAHPKGNQKLPAGFVERQLKVDGIRMNYAMGGSGPTLVLLHGYPQTSHEWYRVMPRLAEAHTVIAPDLRGAGKSEPPRDAYDKATQ